MTRPTVRAAVAAVLCLILSPGCDRAAAPAGKAAAPIAGTPVSPAAGPAARQAAASTGGPPATAEPVVGTEDALADVLQLTHGFDRAGEAYFSADANWIIFQATPKGEKHYQQYVAPLTKDGDRITGAGTPVRISPPNSRNTCGFFSPDGKSLIFASTAGKEKGDESVAGYQRQGGNYRWDFPEGQEIFRADGWLEKIQLAAGIAKDLPGTAAAAANDAAKLTAAGDAGGATNPTIDLAAKPIIDNNAYDAEGAYSPDGKWIVFGSRRDGDSELYVMRPDGTGVVRLTNQKGYDGGPFFAPDGKRVLYRSDRKGNDLLQVFVADLTFDAAGNITGTANERQLTDDANVNWGPYFHPDNRHVVYATSAHGHHNYEVYVMRDDGSQKIRLTYKAGFDGLPVFSPDGRYLMWSSKRSPDNTTQIFLARFLPPSGW